MALDILILSVLRSGPVHGYELKRRVQRPSSGRLSNNSLYPHLNRFEDAGAVTSTIEVQEGRPARRIYTLTPVGHRLFHDLVSTLPAELAADEEEFLVRLSFFHEIDPASRARVLEARTRALEDRIAQITVLSDPASPAPEWRGIALAHLVERLEVERVWVRSLTEKAEHDDEGANVD